MTPSLSYLISDYFAGCSFHFAVETFLHRKVGGTEKKQIREEKVAIFQLRSTNLFQVTLLFINYVGVGGTCAQEFRCL